MSQGSQHGFTWNSPEIGRQEIEDSDRKKQMLEMSATSSSSVICAQTRRADALFSLIRVGPSSASVTMSFFIHGTNSVNLLLFAARELPGMN